MRIPELRPVASRLATCAIALTVVAATAGAQEPSGPEVWAANCGSCHRIRSVDSYGSAQWNSIVTHMALVARLTPAETRAVREFLVSSARAREEAAELSRLGLPLAVARGGDKAGSARSVTGVEEHRQLQSSGAGSLYRSRCGACHGTEGRGDGAAARALNPRPTNFWDLEQRRAVTDSAVRDVIARGRGTMPAFRTQLNGAQLDSLVTYLRGFRH